MPNDLKYKAIVAERCRGVQVESEKTLVGMLKNLIHMKDLVKFFRYISVGNKLHRGGRCL